MASTTQIKAKRTFLKSSITKLNNLIKINTDNIGLIKTKFDNLIKNYDLNFNLNFELIESDPNNAEKYIVEWEEITDMYEELSTVVNDLLQNKKAETKFSADQLKYAPLPQIRLPEISIPQFDGNIEKWQNFRSIFWSRIGNNTSINDVDKIAYLQSSVIGKAARLIEAIDVNENNFDIAWDILKNKYENSRKAILKHWSILHNYTPLRKDTPDAISDLVDVFNQHLRCLKSLGEPIEQCSGCVLYILLSKITYDTKIQWESTLPDNKLPSYKSLIEFLERRGNCSEYSPVDNFKKHNDDYKLTKNRSYSQNRVFLTTNKNNHDHTELSDTSNLQVNITEKKIYPCPICKEPHTIYKCQSFIQTPIDERRQLVKSANLCFNCLSPNHIVRNCKASSCRVCNERHHTYLHNEEEKSERQPTNDLIPTASFYIEESKITCRAIIDTGSSTNFITSDLALTLGLPLNKCRVPIGALNGLSTTSEQFVTATIKSLNNNYQKTIDFLVIPEITSTPDQQIDIKSLNIPKNLKLADPEFFKARPVQLLLGAGVSLSLLCVGQIKLHQSPHPELYLQKTLAGWIVGGTLSVQFLNNANFNLNKIQKDIDRFWEIEEIDNKKQYSEEEKMCEEHYRENVIRNKDGKYVVALPFNEKKTQLGSSRQMALKRFLLLEKRLKNNQELYTEYKAVIDEYIKLGHMVKIHGEPEDGFYLPHHAVIKNSSQTTKVRVVFDASAKSSTGISLNDTLQVGPLIQDDLLSYVLWFRIPQYLITGDIEKMFRQISIREEDQKYLRILWRDEDGNINTYQLTTDTFGLASASFLAIRTIHQLCEDEKHNYPRAAESLKKRLYVDDYIDGDNTIKGAVELRDEVIALLKAGGFNIRQCASNSTKVLQGLPDCNINRQLQDKNDPTLKTLGMYWDSKEDKIIYTVNKIYNKKSVTKRFIFSEISKIFDPLGLLNPAIVPIKILMQEIWRLKLDWDESLPAEIQTTWNSFTDQLFLLNKISFDRNLIPNNAVDIQLHGFCDASLKAYGACIYLRSTDCTGNVKIGLLCAKSRVAPIKTKQTIPKLELCAGLLLTNLYSKVKSAIDVKFDTVTFWTDSMITLHWIRKSPHLLKTFVANRVSMIQSTTDPNDWRHVRTKENPADLLSRGVFPEILINSSIWKQGPQWLSKSENEWPDQPSILTIESIEVPEVKMTKCMAIQIMDNDIFNRYSSYIKLQRIIALCLRFKLSNKNKDILKPEELQNASNAIIKLVQRQAFSNEIMKIQQNISISTKSKILCLRPFLDENGILRVGGRIQNSELTYDRRHPILLPKSNRITDLIIEQEHQNGLHSGVQLTLNNLRLKYWLIDGKNQIRKIIRRCVRCTRVNPPPINYVMGNLPKERVTMSRPFINTGIDYCGPFFVKERKYRNKNKIKIYVVIFVCMATKAVHIDAVSDLTTEAFLGSLRRFISRRGYCKTIYTDNGTNFVGANNEIKDLLEMLSSRDHIEKLTRFLTNKSIEWHFIPPRSPHVGGLWEAAVKSFKHHLKRVMGNELYTFEQFYTLITEIEAILNSRPLSALSTDPNDPTPLTPSHFIIGHSLMSLPEISLLEVPNNRLSLWKQIQKTKQNFWSRWHKEYLQELTVRHKWKTGDHSIKIGSIVMIRDENLPPLQWCMGIVKETLKSDDGVIRTVRVKTSNGELVRNVKRLAPLPIETDVE